MAPPALAAALPPPSFFAFFSALAPSLALPLLARVRVTFLAGFFASLGFSASAGAAASDFAASAAAPSPASLAESRFEREDAGLRFAGGFGLSSAASCFGASESSPFAAAASAESSAARDREPRERRRRLPPPSLGASSSPSGAESACAPSSAIAASADVTGAAALRARRTAAPITLIAKAAPDIEGSPSMSRFMECFASIDAM